MVKSLKGRANLNSNAGRYEVQSLNLCILDLGGGVKLNALSRLQFSQVKLNWVIKVDIFCVYIPKGPFSSLACVPFKDR